MDDIAVGLLCVVAPVLALAIIIIVVCGASAVNDLKNGDY